MSRIYLSLISSSPSVTEVTSFVTLEVAPVTFSATNVPDTGTYVISDAPLALAITVPLAPEVIPVIVSPGIIASVVAVTLNVGNVGAVPRPDDT